MNVPAVSTAAVTAYIGLGSNLGDREGTLRAALAALAGLPGVDGVRASTLRETDPWGAECAGQPPYLNAVAEVRTGLSAHDLLAALQAIENRFGRVRPSRWAPRTLDLDLLLYGDAVVRDAALEVPHPRLAGRRFVLEPLAELAPDRVHPVSGLRFGEMLSAWDQNAAAAF
jgi:2-amino-4-hydroxy-6-hydroxymethyldihydropteridine diphosphokinase